MAVPKDLIEKIETLLPEQRQELARFIDNLARKKPHQPLKSPRGLCKDLAVKITEEDIAEARKEMWGNFPRDIDLGDD